MNTVIPDITELRNKSNKVTIETDAINLENAVVYVSNKLSNLTVLQLKDRKIVLSCDGRNNPLNAINKINKSKLVEIFETAGYSAKWTVSYIGSQFDYDTIDYFNVSWTE